MALTPLGFAVLDGKDANATPLTGSITVPAGATYAVAMVQAGDDLGQPDVTSITIDGTGMTSLGAQSDAALAGLPTTMQMFGLDNPTTGSVTGTVNFNLPPFASVCVFAFFSGQDTTTPTEGFQLSTGTGTAVAGDVSTTTVSGDIVLAHVLANVAGIANISTADTEITEVNTSDAVNVASSFAYQAVTGSGAEVNWTLGSSVDYRTQAILIKPEPDSGSSIDADITEAATASESQSSTLRHSASRTEAATATDAQSNTLSAFASALEAATAIESQSVTSISSLSITESTTASETQSASYTTNSDIEESVTATEASDAESGAFASIEETLTATEESATSLVANATQEESVTASETSSITFTTNAAISESGSASESSSSNFTTSLFATETVTATDDQDADITEPLLDAEIIESANAIETSSNQLIGTASITETGTAQDASFTSNIIAVSITESANATDTVSVFYKLVKRVVDGSLAIRNLSSTLIKRVFSSNLTERDL